MYFSPARQEIRTEAQNDKLAEDFSPAVLALYATQVVKERHFFYSELYYNKRVLS